MDERFERDDERLPLGSHGCAPPKSCPVRDHPVRAATGSLRERNDRPLAGDAGGVEWGRGRPGRWNVQRDARCADPAALPRQVLRSVANTCATTEIGMPRWTASSIRFGIL